MSRRLLAAHLRAMADRYDAAIDATEKAIQAGDALPDDDLDDLWQHRGTLIRSWGSLRTGANDLSGGAR